MFEVETLLKVNDVAKIWGVHRETVLRWVRQGRINAINIGADKPRYRFTKEMASTPPTQLIK
jgi:hypothetical protein